MATRTSPARSSSSSTRSRSGSGRSGGSTRGKGATTKTTVDLDRPPLPVRVLHAIWMALATPVGAVVRAAGAGRVSYAGLLAGRGVVVVVQGVPT